MKRFFRRLYLYFTGAEDEEEKKEDRPPAPVSKKKEFLRSLVAFLLVGCLLQFAEQTLDGQKALDAGFDYLIKKNYAWAVLDNRENEAVSASLRLIFFDAASYRRSYTMGYWTPWDILGQTVHNAVRRGAAVVVVDFGFSGAVPVVMKDGLPFDGGAEYLRLLEEAAQSAREKKALIFLPVPEIASAANERYLKLLRDYGDVLKTANFKVAKDMYDSVIRRFLWYDVLPDRTVALSAGLCAASGVGQTAEEAARREQEAGDILAGKMPDTHLLPPALAEAMHPENQRVSSRLLYRILPRNVVRTVYGGGDNRLAGILWRPEAVNASTSKNPDFSGKVVLVGSDYEVNGDYHLSAFGPISGSHILANSVNMLLTGKINREVKSVNLLFLFSVGVIFSALYTCLSPSLVFLAITLFCLATPAISAYLFNTFGIFFDVWIPAVGIGLYNVVWRVFKFWEKDITRMPVWKLLRIFRRPGRF